MNKSIQQLLADATRLLQPHSPSARADVEILLAHCLQQSRTWLHTWPDKTLTAEQDACFQHLLQRRIAGEPIAYVTGRRGFWQFDLYIDERALIPRPETELLVEQALARIPPGSAYSVLDLGTGSGAIALSLALERPDCYFTATDLSADALTLAHENARQLGLTNIGFVAGDWLQAVNEHAFDMIVSNPPYIADNDPHLSQGDVRFEPRLALASGEQGLDAISIILSEAPNYLKPGGWLLLEHGYDQATAIKALLQQNQLRNIEQFNDLSGHVRVSGGQC